MTDKQRLELRNSEIRSRLATLGAEDATEDGKAEIGKLSEEYGSNETRIRALMVANDAPVETTTTRKESKERAELYASASLGDLVYNLVNGRSGVDGAMAELQKEYGLADNEIHVRQLTPESYAVTPGASDVGRICSRSNPTCSRRLARPSWASICRPLVLVRRYSRC